jgi:cell division protein FtsQ
MSKKQIVSIEDRVPKLKQARKKKANRRLIFYLSIFFFLISIVVYLQSPLSHVRNIQVTGNTSLDEDEVIKQSGVKPGTNIWTINKTKIIREIGENPVIESAAVSRKLPWTVQIKLKEYDRVGYMKKEGYFHPVIGNGTLLALKQKTVHGDAPVLAGFKDNDYLRKMTKELEKLPKSIFNVISEIHWKPGKENKNKIILYMNDGFIVDATMRDFAKKMQVYPSVVSQLEPDSKGIIHIGVGAYFESFQPPEDEGEEDNEVADESGNEPGT